MRVPDGEFRSRPWRIHEVAPDFALEDVWSLPTPGGPDDLPLLVAQIAHADPADGAPWPVRALWAARWRLGELLGLDDDRAGTGGRVSSLRERLPADLRAGPAGPAFDSLPFTSLYLTGDEWAAEIANATMHGVMHLGWVPDGDHYRGQMAVLVKVNGELGRAYMAAIRPFRHRLVYPAMMRQIDRMWTRALDGAARGAADQPQNAISSRATATGSS